VRPFSYRRPTDLATAVALLAEYGSEARVLAGGTDLIIRLRDGTYQPQVVVDVKLITELAPRIDEADGQLVISAGTVMTDIHDDARVRRWFPALAEAARFVGSVQIRNRATLAGNIVNASPAADTVPTLLVYDATVVVHGVRGERRIPIDDVFVRSGVTTIAHDELVTAIELPLPAVKRGSAFARRTRRRGHDLAAVTMAVAVEDGVTRLAFGSLGPRPLLFVGDKGEPDIDSWLAAARPSPTSMRAGPEYRLAMLDLLARRCLRAAQEQLAA
jgi:CO/xanthine dehydrogenase FAD-binding subunit